MNAQRKTNYDSGCQQRILNVITTLAGNEFNGLAPSEISKSIGCAASAVTRDLHNLHKAGFAEQIPETGRWRLGPKVIQLALGFSAALSRARTRLDEISQRYSREY